MVKEMKDRVTPSQMAQAEMPLFQYSASLGRPRRLAVAPVARMREFAFTCNPKQNVSDGYHFSLQTYL